MKKSLLYSQTSKWNAGVLAHEASLGLVHFSGSSLNSTLGNAQQLELSFQAARSATLAASNNLQAARATAILYTVNARRVLKSFLGDQWSTAWTQAGWVNRTLAIPKDTAGALNLVRALQSYFTGHAAQQNAAAGVTAQLAGTHVTALGAGETALNTAKCGQRAKRDARDTGHELLMEQMRGSRKQVESLLKPEDPRWLDFIARVPADLRAPEPVTVIEARPGFPGHISLDWLDSLRADWYEIEAAVGDAVEFVHAATVHDTVADLEFPPGVTVKLRVKARNSAGESAPSPVVTQAVPQAAAA